MTIETDDVSQGKGHPIIGGIVAGLIGGVVLSIALGAGALAHGGDLWMTMKGAGVPFLHERAQQPGFDSYAVLVGIASHLGVSIAWGLVFAALFYGVTKGATVVLGLAWGIVVWVAMYYAVLPFLGLEAMARAAPIGTAVMLHLLFGLAVGVGFLPFQRARPHAVPPRGAPAHT